MLTHKYWEGYVPALHILTTQEQDCLQQLKDLTWRIDQALHQMRFKEGIQLCMDLARVGNKFLTDTAPWKLVKTDKARTGTVLYVALQVIANLSIVLDPFLPFTSKKIDNMLGVQALPWDRIGGKDLIPTGTKLHPPELLFHPIEDAVIAQQREKLECSR